MVEVKQMAESCFGWRGESSGVVLGGIIFLILIAGVAYAQEDCPNEDACNLLKEFEENYNCISGRSLRVEWDSKLPIVRGLHGYCSFGKDIKDSEEAEATAEQFFKNNSQLFGINVSNLKLSDINSDYKSFSVHYKQYYRTVPVEWSGISIAMKKSGGGLRSAGGIYYPNISISPTPKLSKDEAINIAYDYYKQIYPQSALRDKNRYDLTTLVILPAGDYPALDSADYRLVWKVLFGFMNFYVDAHDGTIIDKYSNIVAEGGRAINESSQNESKNIAAISEENHSEIQPLSQGEREKNSGFTILFFTLLIIVFALLLFMRGRSK